MATPRFIVNDPRVFTVPATTILGSPGLQLLDDNPQRVSLLVIVSGGLSLLLGFTPTAGLSGRTVSIPSNKGLSLDSALGTHQGELWGWTTGSAVTVVVLEQVLDPTAANPEDIGPEAAGLPLTRTALPAADRLPWQPPLPKRSPFQSRL
jgi:hypothetical protein